MTCNTNTNTSGSYSVPDNIIFAGDAQFPTSETYKQQSTDWQRVYDALQDSAYIQAKSTQYLPKQPREEAAIYNMRLARSFFTPIFKDGTRALLSRPFSQPISLNGSEDLDPRLQAIEHNTDLLGNSLSSFFNDVLLSAIRYGHVHVLVDFPTVPIAQNLAEEQAIGARPNFSLIPAYDLVNVETENSADGSVLVTKAYIKEMQNVDGESVMHMRVYTTDAWELWAEGDGGWTLVSSGSHTFGAVPILTYYTNRTGYLTSEPPLKAVADLNMLHYSSQSDQRSILHSVRVALLFAKGFEEEETDFAVSVNNLVASSNDSADLKYVEHGGKGIEAGWEDIDRIEDKMTALLGDPLSEKAVNVATTATASYIRESKTTSELLQWTLSLQEFIYRCYTVAGLWIGQDLPDEFKVSVFHNWAAAGRVEDLPYINELQARGIISKTTMIEEYQRRAILSNNFDMELEKKRLEDEGVDNSGETV